MFCQTHTIPHENCPNCRAVVAAMRPTVFAELAAAELCSGAESCPDCDYVYHEAVARCPQCGEPHPFHPERRLTSVRINRAEPREAQQTSMRRPCKQSDDTRL